MFTFVLFVQSQITKKIKLIDHNAAPYLLKILQEHPLLLLNKFIVKWW